MAANGFGTALYTNCAPDQGLDGVAGMQFQSRSAGVEREALTVIRRHLIYEPPDQLIQEEQPVAAFPRSFAHVHDGVFATAAGIYVGREAQGARQGNHLTHAIVTGDARQYRSVRPVQLFDASFWRTEPTASKQSERLAPSWQPGPFDAERAARFVSGQPDGPALLGVILTALLAHTRPQRDIEPRRVLFISDQVETVLLWLTAATLLMPQQEAVRLGFKVFTADPARSALPVVAVHPDWVKSAATVEHDRGYVVFDLVRHQWTPLKESAEAGHWAQLFCQADPYEVSEAVELAQASGLAGEFARELAAAAVLRQPPSPVSADRLVRWLQTGPPLLREAYGGTLATVIAQLHDLRLLREVDGAADNQFPGKRDQIRLELLRLELDNALRDPMMFQPDRPRRPVSAAARQEAERLVTETLRQAQRSAFDAVLRVSSRFDVAVPSDTIQAEAVAFAAFWADNPDVGYEPSAWPPTLPVIDLLRAQLPSRIISEPELADSWYRRFPGWIPDRTDLTSPLERALLAAAMANSAPPERMRIVRSMLSRHGSAKHPGRYRDVAAALWHRTGPSFDELRALCDLVPPDGDLDPEMFAGVLVAAHRNPTHLPALELSGRLAEKRLLTLDSETQRLLGNHHWLREFERRLSARLTTPEEIGWLGEMAPAVVNAHAEPLTRGLIAVGDGVLALDLLRGLPDSAMTAFLKTVLAYKRPLSPAEVALTVIARSRLERSLRRGWPPVDPAALATRDYYAVVGEWCRAEPKNRVWQVTSILASWDGELAAKWKLYAADMRRQHLPLRVRVWRWLWPAPEEPDR